MSFFRTSFFSMSFFSMSFYSVSFFTYEFYALARVASACSQRVKLARKASA